MQNALQLLQNIPKSNKIEQYPAHYEDMAAGLTTPPSQTMSSTTQHFNIIIIKNGIINDRVMNG